MQARRLRLLSKTVIAGKGKKGRCQREDGCLGACAGDSRVLVREDSRKESVEVWRGAGDGLNAGY